MSIHWKSAESNVKISYFVICVNKWQTKTIEFKETFCISFCKEYFFSMVIKLSVDAKDVHRAR